MANIPRDSLTVANEFSGHGLWLSKVLLRLYPRDDGIARTNDRLKVAKMKIPETVIRKAGPYLHAYRDDIRKYGVKYFLDPSVQAEITESLKEEVEADAQGAMMDIIHKISSSWSKLKPAEQTEINDKVVNMLDLYMEYCRMTK